MTRIEGLASDLHGHESAASLARDLIAILADAGVERRGLGFATVYANVACPATGEVWFTFGGCPAASRGRWAEVAWPW